jgi:hypothetical protein
MTEIKGDEMSTELARTYGGRDEVKELASRLQKMMPGAARFTEEEALTVAQVAVSHGLDPFNGEVWGIKYEKEGRWVWAGVMVGIKGLRKSARRQGNYWMELRRVEPAQYGAGANAIVYECHMRDSERIQAYGKSINMLTTSGVPYTDAVAMLGPAPVYIGVGIGTPDERSKMSIHARARKRAEADAIKQAYDVQFGGAMLENGAVIEGDVTVLGFDDDHQLPAIAASEPRSEQSILSDLGYDDEPEPAPIQPPSSLMTLEMAISEVGSDGVKYGDKDTKTLAAMANTIDAKLRTARDWKPDEREEKQRKLDACRVILADRANQ